MEAMPQIDLEPTKHSHLYELKPLSRWWFAFAVLLCLGAAFINGFSKPETWALVVAGGFLCGFAFLCFPRYWLSKIND